MIQDFEYQYTNNNTKNIALQKLVEVNLPRIPVKRANSIISGISGFLSKISCNYDVYIWIVIPSAPVIAVSTEA